MADPKSNDAPANAAKPAGASGAVKPPVLEGKARPVDQKPAAEASPKPAASTTRPADTAPPPPPKSKPDTPSPPPKAGSGLSPWLAGALGGALGLGAAYGLAVAGYWPAPALPAPVVDSRIDELAASVPEVRTIADTTQSELARLTARVAALETAEPTTAPDADLAASVAQLATRVDELAATAPADTATSDANASAIVALQSDTTALQDRVGSIAVTLDEVTSRLAALSASISDAGSDEAGIVRLPLILGGLETAFGSGHPFETELAALSRARPDTTVPPALATSAVSGLPSPEAINQQLQAALPDMLAARPADADAGWQGATADWFRGILALRPSGPIDGESPDALLTQLEDAVARRDFRAAQTAFAALPPAMQTASGGLGDDLASLAAAQQFILDLRQAALAEGTTP